MRELNGKTSNIKNEFKDLYNLSKANDSLIKQINHRTNKIKDAFKENKKYFQSQYENMEQG